MREPSFYEEKAQQPVLEEDGPAPPVTLSQPYLMVVVQMPLYRDASGRLFAEQLWGRDLIRHLDYIQRLAIACPCLTQEPPRDAICLDTAAHRLEVVELPEQPSPGQTMRVLPRLIRTLWEASERAEIVHTTIAGWPVPMGWIAGPIALLQGKKLIVIVESAPWRIPPGVPAGWRARLRSGVQELAGRWLLRRSSLPIFTQDGYRQSMLGEDAGRGFVNPASWIDEADVVSVQEAKLFWREKMRSAGPRLRILYAGRLVSEKGLPVLLQAMRLLAKEDVSIQLDILGEGPLEGECSRVGHELRGAASVRVLGTVAYGAPLFNRIREYHAMAIPSISDEQPRIVFDSYSQGVPVIASDTEGLRSCITEGITGLFFTPGDPAALASLLRRMSEDPEQLQILGTNAIGFAREMTHQKMHRDRAARIGAMLNAPEG